MKKSSAAGDSLLRTVLRMVCWIVLIISALLGTYMAAALAGSLMPANMGWVEPGQGVRIFVYSNGVHTGIVVPTANKVKDWRSLVRPRSEEHTSELQSLMRISYAVFCLKKNNM